jgi:hypothetical protein
MDQDARNTSLTDWVTEIKTKIGTRSLTEEEILFLAADAILHSYTYEEKGYA